MKKFCMSFLLLGAFSLSAMAATEETKLLRFPASNGEEIIFSYAGDLYKVPMSGGSAMRLTSHIGYEMFPRYSPDGKSVAFTAQYDGNTEVYTIPAEGGEPLRLTYTPTNSRDDIGDRMGPNNIVMGWSADGEQIIYRNRIGDGFIGKLYTVSKDGGLSTVVPLPEGGFCSYSPDGSLLAYNRVMREFRTWKYYRGGMADDVWIYDEKNSSVENITENDAQDIIPMWVGDQIFFLSDRDRTMNIFVYNRSTKQTEKVTSFTDYDVKFPSCHGTTIVFEQGGSIFTLDAQSREVKKVAISVASDNVYARPVYKDGADYLTNVSLSKDGKNIALTARGEVFSVPTGKGAVKSLTRSSGANDRSAQYSPDGEKIAYISDISGETELYLQAAAGGAPEQLTKKNDTYIRNFTWSPDGKSIIYTDRKNRMNLLTVESKKVKTLMQNPNGEYYGVAFSPDSKWITYTRSAENTFGVIYAYNLAEGKEVAITDDWYDSSSPIFSEDGKYIIFSSARDFNPIYSNTEWNHAYTNMNGIYMAILSKDTPSPFLYEQVEEPQGEKKGSKDDEKADAPAEVTIDADGILDRTIKLPISAGRYNGFYSNGKKVYYNSNKGATAFDLKSQKESIVAEGARMSVVSGSKKALFRKGKSIYVADIPADKARLENPVDISNVKIEVNYKEEWAQIFDEAWRAFRDGFYVENMHGVDWPAMKKKYSALLPYVTTRLDLNYIIGEMIGELTCGHCYVNPGETDRPERISMGLLGAEISRDKSGYFRLEKILKGVSWDKSHRSPLTETGLNVEEGNYIIAIDGIPTNSVKDMFSLLVGKAEVPTELTINTTASSEGARTITILPIDNEYPLYHNEWVQKNIETVDKASGGKIGYIYVPDMGVGGLIEFTRYFYPQLNKEGLIIDDRENGGGNVSPMLIERLSREAYSLTMRRGSERVSTIPDATHTGPKVCLINKYSASDGDLFPWRFRAEGLGKLIGTRTWGGIVGISGPLQYIDGTDIRVPFFTNYDPVTGDWVVENHGVDPDILIDNDPIKEWKGEDEQLNRAIEEVMLELKDRKEFPGIPAPRVWNK
ncbi:MAG: PDZ domain-containing protein [Rikenellaceae bacterium]